MNYLNVNNLTGGTGSTNFLAVNNLTGGTGSTNFLAVNNLTGGTGSFNYFTGGTGSMNYLNVNNLTGGTGSFQNLAVNNLTGGTGSFNTVNATSFTSASDYRIKYNIEPLSAQFTTDLLKPVKYLNTKLNKNDIGLIAHEVQEIYPELVNGDKDGFELQSLNYIGLIPILINENKILKKRIEKIEEEMLELKCLVSN
jgi:hypothetical protein